MGGLARISFFRAPELPAAFAAAWERIGEKLAGQRENGALETHVLLPKSARLLGAPSLHVHDLLEAAGGTCGHSLATHN
eukprot:CAMPEP_0115047574 /NCGR_PEP_ID=MMETSP0227-20121206/25_1 /TAXON_ID=89957 /ORGANISM="Polarella glacialis, Strain CCMP 1383" /LENGTH=78 /DNA_ID=CAMNT_0002430775 /DNA_START=452 /DNA_END=685 /DNA_ORIENTATION=-